MTRPRLPVSPELTVPPELAAVLLGVIDLRGGRAVHAIAGRRSEYRPLRCAACPDADPVRLAEHYRSLGVGGLYVADLDRIIDRNDASRHVVDRLCRFGLPIWIDAGLRSTAELPSTASRPASGRAGDDDSAGEGRATWIIGTETLSDLELLRATPNGPVERSLAVSLDLRGGRVVSACRQLAGCPPLEAARRIAATGVRRLIVLDLCGVGTGAGPVTAELCRRIKQDLPELTIVSGGGVRGAADVRRLVAAGCAGVLAASWLHGERNV